MSVGSGLLGDLRLGLKSLRRTPGFTLIAVITLGLGIGAYAAAFSVVNEVLLRPLPYPDEERLDRIYRASPQASRGGLAPADYLDLVERAAEYGAFAGYGLIELNLTAAGEPPETVRGMRVSRNMFGLLGITPALGRDFRPGEETVGNDRVVLISDRLWRSRFGADPHVVRRTLRADGELHDIVGVLPAHVDDWRHLGPFDVFRPLAFSAE